MPVAPHEVPLPRDQIGRIQQRATINVVGELWRLPVQDQRVETKVAVPGAEVELFSNPYMIPQAMRTPEGDLVVSNVSHIRVRRVSGGRERFRSKRDVTVIVHGEVETAKVSDGMPHKEGPGLAKPRGITLEVGTVGVGTAENGGRLVVRQSARKIRSSGPGSFVWATEVTEEAAVNRDTGADAYILLPPRSDAL